MFLIILLSAFLLLSCQEKGKSRQYQEISIQGFAQKEQIQRISYRLPKIWEQIPVKNLNNQLNLNALLRFRFIKDNSFYYGTITEILGEAGSDESNVLRWMKQIEALPMSSSKIQTWLKTQTHFTTSDGLEGIFIDLTTILSSNIKLDQSIIAAIIKTPTSKIFVKLEATKTILKENRQNLLEFSRSIRLEK